MTANVYLVKLAEMNKAAGDADDNKPSIARGALMGAGRRDWLICAGHCVKFIETS